LRVIFCLLWVISSVNFCFAQQATLNGLIQNAFTGEPLSFANIRLDGTSRGTAANTEGFFEMRLDTGYYRLITSFIGFQSDTLNFKFLDDASVTIGLKPVTINLPDIVVLPGINPAIEIIKKTIAAKHKRNEILNSYMLEAYTKGLIKTTKDISTGNNSVSLSISGKDTADLKITGILENQSRGYFKKPDKYKDEIIARKQTANAPSTVNLLTGGRMQQNFYTDNIEFFNRPLPSPISDDALDYYYFMIEDRLAMNDLNIFQIYFLPSNESDPGFEGRIFIADSIFTLIKLDISLNRAANPGGLLDTVAIFQQFVPFDDNIYMPIDYRLFAEGNFLGIAKFGFELHSIFYNYEINSPIDDEFFDMAVLSVLPEVDKKDSTYWKDIERIPNTTDEIIAYERIDSISSVPRNYWDNFSLLSTRTYLAENFGINGPLSLYHFNVVEGHSINFAVFADRAFDKRFNAEFNAGYGFSDKKLKMNFSAEWLFGQYRTTSVSFNAYNRLNDLFSETNYYNRLTSTLTSWLGKYDFRDYYYTKGFNLSASAEVSPILEINAGFFNKTDKSAINNTDFSIFNTSKEYTQNRAIYNTKINAVTAGIKIDFRKYIEDGNYRIRLSRVNAFPVIRFNAAFSNSSLLKSEQNFQMYKMNITGTLKTLKSAQLSYELTGIIFNGAVPFQMLYALPGNIENAGKNFTFRTLKIGEAAGDRACTIMIEHDFKDELFRLLNIPILKNLELSLALHFNMAWTNISSESYKLLPTESYKVFLTPFYEAGFSIGHMLIPVELEFTWRLNHMGTNDFVFGFNTFAL